MDALFNVNIPALIKKLEQFKDINMKSEEIWLTNEPWLEELRIIIQRLQELDIVGSVERDQEEFMYWGTLVATTQCKEQDRFDEEQAKLRAEKGIKNMKTEIEFPPEVLATLREEKRKLSNKLLDDLINKLKKFHDLLPVVPIGTAQAEECLEVNGIQIFDGCRRVVYREIEYNCETGSIPWLLIRACTRKGKDFGTSGIDEVLDVIEKKRRQRPLRNVIHKNIDRINAKWRSSGIKILHVDRVANCIVFSPTKS